MKRVNVFTVEAELDPTDPVGYRSKMARLGPILGGSILGGSVYELPSGQSVCPYHYELGEEEWLIVLVGHPTLRHPEGEERLDPGDAVCFTTGPAGAHKITNHGDEVVRVLLISNVSFPAVTVYPDSGKVGVYTEGGAEDLIVRRQAGVDYWDGEE